MRKRLKQFLSGTLASLTALSMIGVSIPTYADTETSSVMESVIEASEEGTEETGAEVNSNVSDENSEKTEVTISPSENGSVTFDDGKTENEIPEGETVTLKVTPVEGYALKSLIIKDTEGEEIANATEKVSEFTFTMPECSLVIEAAFEKSNDTTDNKSAELKIFTKIAEDSVLTEGELSAYDFSSKRLLVAGDIIDPENELSSYDGVHLMQYKSESETKYAFSYYYGKAEFVDIDSNFSIATGSGYNAESSEMTEAENPLTELSEETPVSAKGTVIALIDTGSNSSSNVISRVSMIGNDVSDENGHGTKMAELISKANPSAQILSIKALGAEGTGDVSAVYAAIKYAIESKVDIISLSISSIKREDNAAIASIIEEAISDGIKVVAAAGNNASDAKYYTPGSISGVYTIGAADKNGVRLSSSNYGNCVAANVVADSTSEAAATYAGLLSAGNGEIDYKTVYPVDYSVKEGPNVKWQTTFFNYESDDMTDAVYLATRNTAYTTIENGYIKSTILFNQEDIATIKEIDVYTDFASVKDEKNITDECSWDEDTMTVSIPEKYVDENLTIRWYMSNASYAYAALSEYPEKNTPEKFFSTAYDARQQSWETNGSAFVGVNGDSTYTVDSSDFDSFTVGTYFTVKQGYTAIMDGYCNPTRTGNDGSVTHMNMFTEVVNNTTGQRASFLENIGETGSYRVGNSLTTVSGNWIPGSCVYDEQRGAVPNFSSATIKCIAKDSDTATFFYEAESPTAQWSAGIFKVKFEPQTGYLQIHKKLENQENLKSYDISPEGIQFGVYSDKACTAQVATLTINVSGDSEKIKLPIGTYYIKETTTCDNYQKNDQVYNIEITKNNKESQNAVLLEAKNYTEWQAQLNITKSNKDYRTGPYDFSDVTFVINYYDGEYELDSLPTNPTRSWTIKLDSENKASLDEEHLVEGSDDLYYVNGEVRIPCGTITVEEVSMNKAFNKSGYVVTDKDGKEVIGKYLTHVEAQNGEITIGSGLGDLSVTNQVYRADLDFTKQDDKGNNLANIPFEIINDETGESHIIYTDENGYASTKAVAHSQNTNANTSESGSSENGIWFGDQDKVDDNSGALPYGSYTINELSCENNKNTDLVEGIKVVVGESNETISLGTVIDNTPQLQTFASDKETGDRVVAANAKSTITDKVILSNFTEGREYDIKADLHKISADGTETIVDTKTQKVTFSPDEDGMQYVYFDFDVDTTDYAEGDKYVVTEKAYYNTHKVSTHEDLTDENQTVYIPTIHTVASDGNVEDEDHQITSSENGKIIDTVSYTNLIKDETYILKGTLIDKATGKEVLSSEATFVAEDKNGSAIVTFDADTTAFAGQTLVVYEELYSKNEVLLADHKEISNEKQTVYIPSIKTKAIDTDTKTHTGAVKEKASVTDTVSYTNLVSGLKYRVVGYLVDSETGEIITDKEGKQISSTVDFVAGNEKASNTETSDENNSKEKTDTTDRTNVTDESSVKSDSSETITDINTEDIVDEDTDTVKTVDGEVQIVFEYDTTELGGRSVVVFEKLYKINDNESVKIDDGAVLVPDNASDNKKDESSNTSIVDSTDYLTERFIMEHCDLTDTEQTINYPSIGTTATVNGNKSASSAGTVTISDVVKYENLVVGETYEVEGTLMDKSTGKAFLVNGNVVKATGSFEATEKSGEVTVEFVFDATNLGDKELVAYEKLYSTETKTEITKHEDINDGGQTVTLNKPQTNTGDSFGKMMIPAAVLGIGALGIVVVLVAVKRKKNK